MQAIAQGRGRGEPISQPRNHAVLASDGRGRSERDQTPERDQYLARRRSPLKNDRRDRARTAARIAAASAAEAPLASRAGPCPVSAVFSGVITRQSEGRVVHGSAANPLNRSRTVERHAENRCRRIRAVAQLPLYASRLIGPSIVEEGHLRTSHRRNCVKQVSCVVVSKRDIIADDLPNERVVYRLHRPHGVVS